MHGSSSAKLREVSAHVLDDSKIVLTQAFPSLVPAESPSAQFVSDIRENLASNLTSTFNFSH